MYYRLLTWYRRTLNSSWVPDVVKRFTERIGLRWWRDMFSNRHTRFQAYRVGAEFGKPFTMMLDWQDYTDSAYIFFRTYESGNARFLASIMRPGDTFIDVGANLGYFSLLVASRLPASRVIAVEPLRRNIHSLRESIRANDLKNITVEPVAIGKDEGEVSLEHRFANSGSPSIVSYFGQDEVKDFALLAEPVQVTTLPALLTRNGITTCRCIKMDIQGAERDAIAAGIELLKRRSVDYFIVEHNESVYGDEVRALFTENGYLPHTISADGALTAVPDTVKLRNKQDYVFSPH